MTVADLFPFLWYPLPKQQELSEDKVVRRWQPI